MAFKHFIYREPTQNASQAAQDPVNIALDMDAKVGAFKTAIGGGYTLKEYSGQWNPMKSQMWHYYVFEN